MVRAHARIRDALTFIRVLFIAFGLLASSPWHASAQDPSVPLSRSEDGGRRIFLPLISGAEPMQEVMSAQAETKVKVLIAFANQPGPAESALVREMGGDIKYTYHLVPAIAASVPLAALEGLRHNPHVTAVEPDIEAHVVDAELDNAWGVKQIGAGLIHAQGKQGAGVKVGILDTGIDLDHPDLAYEPACSASFVEGQSLDDGHSHGTHVAGTVAALDNDAGVVGAAPAAMLCIYKVFSDSGSGDYSDVIAALERAVTDGVQVTNNSFGSSTDPGVTVKAAYDNSYTAGLLHVGAAGNNGNLLGTGENCLYPARWDSVIATAATTQNDTRAFFSSTCPQVELAAPGDQVYSAMPGGGYGYKSGTSMASPHVAGTAALVLAAKPGWSNGEVRARLQVTARDLGELGQDPWYGFGLVDAGKAANDPPAAAFATVCTDLRCEFDAASSADPDGLIVSYNWNFGDGATGSGVTISHAFVAAGSYGVILTATDNGGATGIAAQGVTVTEPLRIHVGDLEGASITSSKNWDAQVTVTVHAADHQSVANATVNGVWSGSWSGVGICTTGANGTCTVTSGAMPKKNSNSAVWTVSRVDHGSFTYSAADNHDPTGNSSGTAIRVNKDGTTSNPQ